MMHGHFTRSSAKVHINTVSTLNHRNFVYHSTLCWNDCSLELRMLHMEFTILSRAFASQSTIEKIFSLSVLIYLW